MSDRDDKTSDMITYVDLAGAPHVYFDLAPAHGVMANNVEIELAARRWQSGSKTKQRRGEVRHRGAAAL